MLEAVIGHGVRWRHLLLEEHGLSAVGEATSELRHGSDETLREGSHLGLSKGGGIRRLIQAGEMRLREGLGIRLS